ncbi:MAG: hypothetical protein ABIU63_03640 [Chitinophagaceae bacterium]
MTKVFRLRRRRIVKENIIISVPLPRIDTMGKEVVVKAAASFPKMVYDDRWKGNTGYHHGRLPAAPLLRVYGMRLEMISS